MLQKVRLKSIRVAAMEINGHVNSEADQGSAVSCVARRATFPPCSSSQSVKHKGYLSCSEIGNRIAIHHRLTCY